MYSRYAISTLKYRCPGYTQLPLWITSSASSPKCDASSSPESFHLANQNLRSAVHYIIYQDLVESYTSAEQNLTGVCRTPVENILEERYYHVNYIMNSRRSIGINHHLSVAFNLTFFHLQCTSVLKSPAQSSLINSTRNQLRSLSTDSRKCKIFLF
jgi:hypothetical protein